MSKQANKTMIGGFVVGALVLSLIAVVIFGPGKFFKETYKYIMFFEGSVKGLNIGAPVAFCGVRVGTVSDISMHLRPSDLSVDILVTIEVGRQKWLVSEEMDLEKLRPQTKEAREEFLRRLIERGLRAQLEMQSLVTGQLMISLDFHPEKPAKFVGAVQRYPEIPTVPTAFQQISTKIYELDFEELADELKNTLHAITDAVNSPELAKVIIDLRETVKHSRSIAEKLDAHTDPIMSAVEEGLGETRKLVRSVDEQATPLLQSMRVLVRNVDERIDPVTSQIRTVLQSAKGAFDQAATTLAHIQEETSPNSSFRYHIDEALSEISTASRSFRVLAEYLEQRPEALLRGKTPTGER